MWQSITYYCLHKLKIRLSEFAEMDIYEKAFIMACIDIKIKKEKESEKEAKRKAGRKRR